MGEKKKKEIKYNVKIKDNIEKAVWDKKKRGELVGLLEGLLLNKFVKNPTGNNEYWRRRELDRIYEGIFSSIDGRIDLENFERRMLELATTRTHIITYRGNSFSGDGCGGIDSETYWDTHMIAPVRIHAQILVAATYVAKHHESFIVTELELVRVAENLWRYIHYRRNKLDAETNAEEINY